MEYFFKWVCFYLLGIFLIPVFSYAEGPVAATSTGELQITSSTHPDQNAWYKATTTALSWGLSADAESVRMSISSKPDSIPTRLYSKPISEKVIGDVAEGVWYFNLQAKNKNGWGPVAHFRIQIDTTNPEHFVAAEVLREDSTDPNPVFTFDAFDALSGIAVYDISLDGATSTIVQAAATTSPSSSSTQTSYQLEKVAPGDHILSVQAVDKAGNSISQEVSFHVEALPAPTFVEYKKEATEGGVIVIKGVALPDAQVKIFVSKDGVGPTVEKVLADPKGNFTYGMFEKVQQGTYQFSAQTVNTLGAESAMSGSIDIAVKRSGVVVLSSMIFGYLPIIGLAVLFTMFMWFGWRAFRTFKKKLGKETIEVKDMSQHKKMIQNISKEMIWSKPKKDPQQGMQVRIQKLDQRK